MLRPLLLSGALLGLAACATVEAPVPPPEQPPAPVAGYDWIAQVEPDAASLAYGVAESDDVPLMLACAPGRRRVEITRPADAARPSLTLSVGEATLTVAVESEPSQLHDGVFLVGQASTAEPMLQAFRRTGWLWLHEDGARHGLAGHPGALPGIERFFQACG